LLAYTHLNVRLLLTSSLECSLEIVFDALSIPFEEVRSYTPRERHSMLQSAICLLALLIPTIQSFAETVSSHLLIRGDLVHRTESGNECLASFVSSLHQRCRFTCRDRASSGRLLHRFYCCCLLLHQHHRLRQRLQLLGLV